MTYIERLIPMIISIFIYGTIFYFVLNMEKQKCKCTNEPRRDIIKWYSLASIAAVFLLPLIPIKYGMVLTPIIILCNLAYFVILFTYTHSLKHKKECECSNTWRRTFTFIYSILALVMIGLLVLSLIFVVYYNRNNLKKISNSKSK